MPTKSRTVLALVVVVAVSILLAEHILADTQNGVVKVTSTPIGATVYIKGREFGPTPVLIELQQGTHTATVSLDGYPPKKKVLKVQAGRTTQAVVNFLDSVPNSSVRVHNTEKGGEDSGPGTVTIMTSPVGLSVYMNDILVPRLTPVAFDIHAGMYQMQIKFRGKTLIKKTVYVRAGRTIDFDFNVKQRREIDVEDPWH